MDSVQHQHAHDPAAQDPVLRAGESRIDHLVQMRNDVPGIHMESGELGQPLAEMLVDAVGCQKLVRGPGQERGDRAAVVARNARVDEIHYPPVL